MRVVEHLGLDALQEELLDLEGVDALLFEGGGNRWKTSFEVLEQQLSHEVKSLRPDRFLCFEVVEESGDQDPAGPLLQEGNLAEGNARDTTDEVGEFLDVARVNDAAVEQLVVSLASG